MERSSWGRLALSRGSLGVAVLALVVGSAGGGAVAAGLITGKDIKDGSIQARDLGKNSVTSVKIQDGTVQKWDLSTGVRDQLAKAGTPGPQGPQGEPGEPAAYEGPNWSVVDRNTEGNGDAFLRAGPSSGPDVAPPLGVGSLGLRTGSNTDKAAFGNQVDFAGVPLSDITAVSYSTYTTGENRAKYVENLPSVSMEINPKNGSSYSTLVYTPTEVPANTWGEQDGTNGKRWWLTGSAGTSTGCNQTTYCTLAEVREKLPDATLYSVQITKGKDYAFSGAVDKLTLGSTVYDFEPFGVTASPVAP